MVISEQTTDEELIAMIREKDKELFSIIIQRYEKKLYHYINTLIKDPDKTADILQISFIKSFTNLNDFNINKKFSSWIYRIAHNETLNTLKKYHKETPILDDQDFSSDENIEENFAQKETGEQVNKCISKLPIKYSEPLVLYHIEKKTYAEISDILRVPMGTISVRINRAKKLLKKLCQKI